VMTIKDDTLPTPLRATRPVVLELEEAPRMSPGNLENLREAAACLKELARVAEDHGATERAASDFLLELIAAFEIAQRGFLDVGVRAAASGEEKPG
jgi:hypothetical protein